MNFPNADFSNAESKPAAPWSPEELMDFFAERLEKGDFYMIAGDNEVTPDVDRRRMEWAVNDMIQNRPALSRWHP
ncbi:SDR family NAD(P)-dependent oxidoreductase, partial [Streptococcus pyogenes]